MDFNTSSSLAECSSECVLQNIGENVHVAEQQGVQPVDKTVVLFYEILCCLFKCIPFVTYFRTSSLCWKDMGANTFVLVTSRRIFLATEVVVNMKH